MDICFILWVKSNMVIIDFFPPNFPALAIRTPFRLDSVLWTSLHLFEHCLTFLHYEMFQTHALFSSLWPYSQPLLPEP